MELSSRLSDGAAKMSELMGVMARGQDKSGRGDIVVFESGRRLTQDRGCSADIQEPEVVHPPSLVLTRNLCFRDTIAVSQPSTLPVSHGALMVVDRGFHE